VIRGLVLLAAGAAMGFAQTPLQSVEFPWVVFPRALWERELVWVKNIGIGHVSLPAGPAERRAELAELVRIIRHIGLEADLEGPVPDEMMPQTHAHGGPLNDTPPGAMSRISALAPDALMRGRKVLTSSAPAILWTDVEDTIGPSGFHAGAVSFAGQEGSSTGALRRNAQLSKFWGATLAALRPLAGAGPKLPAPGVTAQQFASSDGTSFVWAINNTAKPWNGELQVHHPATKRVLFLTKVMVPAHDSLWLPVNVPLAPGPLCKNCSAFSAADRVVSASAELTAMEYENGILALEFSAPSAGEITLQLSREPSGPLVAGGKPTEFDWDEATKRAHLPIPAGKGAGNRVRIGLAIEAPDATAFFDSAKVLLIGETNHLVAQFSSDAILQRSRLLAAPELRVTQDAAKEPLKSIFNIAVPANVVHGDRTELAIEADGMRMSHAAPEYMRPVQIRFTDELTVQVGPHSTLPLFPAAVPVNQRAGREVTLSIRNNAPEIRSFHVELKAEGLEFSPATMDVAVGVSTARDISFRVFATGATPGVHEGEARVTGAAEGRESVRFVVIPQTGDVAWTADGFTFLESAKTRAALMGGHWFEYVNKDNGQNAIGAGGVPFSGGAVEMLHLQDLEALLPKAKH
jgi:hypothetical protein